MVHQSPVRIADIGYAEDGHEIQTNIVRVDGQRSVYVPVLKQGGDTNTIAVVGSGVAMSAGFRITAWSLTPSRMGIMTSVRW